MKLTIRRNGKYYQLGYYEKGKWINKIHLGTPEQLVCKLETLNEVTNRVSIHTKSLPIKSVKK